MWQLWSHNQHQKDWGSISASTGKPYKEPAITVKGQRLQVVDKFTYLGSTLSRVVHIDDEVNARIAKASAAFGRLRGSIWDRSGIRLDTKLKVYRSVVLPTLLYACETWTVYQRHAKRLHHFHTSCLRKLLKIKWEDRIPDTEVLKRARMQSVHTLLKLAQLRCTGHVTRMPDERLPNKILNGELQVGKSSHGGQKKRYKDTLKASRKDFIIPIVSWEQIAQDRTKRGWTGGGGVSIPHFPPPYPHFPPPFPPLPFPLSPTSLPPPYHHFPPPSKLFPPLNQNF